MHYMFACLYIPKTKKYSSKNFHGRIHLMRIIAGREKTVKWSKHFDNAATSEFIKHIVPATAVIQCRFRRPVRSENWTRSKYSLLHLMLPLDNKDN